MTKLLLEVPDEKFAASIEEGQAASITFTAEQLAGAAAGYSGELLRLGEHLQPVIEQMAVDRANALLGPEVARRVTQQVAEERARLAADREHFARSWEQYHVGKVRQDKAWEEIEAQRAAAARMKGEAKAALAKVERMSMSDSVALNAQLAELTQERDEWRTKYEQLVAQLATSQQATPIYNITPRVVAEIPPSTETLEVFRDEAGLLTRAIKRSAPA